MSEAELVLDRLLIRRGLSLANPLSPDNFATAGYHLFGIDRGLAENSQPLGLIRDGIGKDRG